jgi:hypothetical protein
LLGPASATPGSGVASILERPLLALLDNQVFSLSSASIITLFQKTSASAYLFAVGGPRSLMIGSGGDGLALSRRSSSS